MQFVSFGFLIFLPLAVLINFIVPRKLRYIWLLLISLAFYISLDLKAAAVLAVTVVLNYAGGILLGKRADGPAGKGTSAGDAGNLSAKVTSSKAAGMHSDMDASVTSAGIRSAKETSAEDTGALSVMESSVKKSDASAGAAFNSTGMSRVAA